MYIKISFINMIKLLWNKQITLVFKMLHSLRIHVFRVFVSKSIHFYKTMTIEQYLKLIHYACICISYCVKCKNLGLVE